MAVAHPTARAGLAVIASLLLLECLGCDANRQRVDTAPLAKSAAQRDAVSSEALSPDELSTDDLSADVSSSGRFARPTTLGGPIGGLDAAQLALFFGGQAEFEEQETIEEGLGPVFNEAACVTCHNAPVGGTNGRAETRFGRLDGDDFDPLADLGGSLIQDHAIGLVGSGGNTFLYVPEVVPSAATVTARRITNSLFGLGLVDAVTDETFVELAERQARMSPSTRGTPNLVTEIRTGATRVGRFGWKAQVPTLHQFSGDAYLNEMGITNPEFPDENPPQGNHDALSFNPVPAINDDGEAVAKFLDFMTLLGPPPRGPRSGQTAVGGMVFRKIGCANCHTPTLVTGDSPIAALSHKAFQPFSDFLLHDMGTLGDGIVQGRSTGSQMRTAPLWGLSSRPVLLHDGRARTPEAAILEHRGQGRDARDRFTTLDARERVALLAFLGSL